LEHLETERTTYVNLVVNYPGSNYLENFVVNYSDPVRSPFCHQWILARVLKRIQGQIDVQGWPMEVYTVVEFHVQDVLEFGLRKPREILVRQEKLLLTNQNPDSVGVNVGDFRQGSTGAKR
jgi:hypothetical protein